MAKKRPTITSEEEEIAIAEQELEKAAEELIATGMFKNDTKKSTKKAVNKKKEDKKEKAKKEPKQKKEKKAKDPAKKEKVMGILKKVFIGTVASAVIATATFSALNFFKTNDINQKLDEGVKVEEIISSGENTDGPVDDNPVKPDEDIVYSTKVTDDTQKVEILKNLSICKTTKAANKISNVEILDAEEVVDANSKIAYIRMENEDGQTMLCPVTINCDETTKVADAIMTNGATIVSGTQFNTFYSVDSLFTGEAATAVEDYVKGVCGDTTQGTQAYVTKVFRNDETQQAEYSFVTVSNDGSVINRTEQARAIQEYENSDSQSDFYAKLAGVTISQENERTR